MLFVAREGAYLDPPAALSAQLRRLLVELSVDAKPGDLGATASTLVEADKKSKRRLRRLVAGVLPNKISRHGSPARAPMVEKVVGAAGFSAKRGPHGIIVALEHKSHLYAALAAIVRSFPKYSRKSNGEETDSLMRITVIDEAGAAIAVDETTKLTLETTRRMAELVDLPPAELTPAAFADVARELLGSSVAIEELVGDALLEAGLGGIHAVGRAALVPPRMLIARYRPERAKGKELALVGKGITFDTGGLHLKARGNMETMKCDMGGAAAVLGAFRVLVAEAPRRPLSLVLCIAENAIGPTAYKPDDVITLHSKKTVEINNTDAEGRLLLADGVSYAGRVLGAKTVLDAATLTGAQLYATGSTHAAVVSNSDKLERILVDAGYSTGDLVHPLLFAPEFMKGEFKSPVADMRNSVKNRMGPQTSAAAQFVYNHIEDLDLTWGHVDLAGPAFRNDRATGFGVALLAEAARRA
ncbi:MAG: leucyl aminopeptidase family protein [Deltaproteobacteria bacterium]|nr:leucyl aminopeptidase family protein [Deltaproteobacteria bacterium]